MYTETDKIYLDKIDEIGDKVYDLYNLGGRKDLVMLYSMEEKRIYSYVYKDYLASLNPRSQQMLKAQYAAAQKEGKIVLFIQDKKRRKFKSYTI